MNLMRGIDLKKIAEKMGGASGAELKAITGPVPTKESLFCHISAIRHSFLCFFFSFLFVCFSLNV